MPEVTTQATLPLCDHLYRPGSVISHAAGADGWGSQEYHDACACGSERVRIERWRYSKRDGMTLVERDGVGVFALCDRCPDEIPVEDAHIWRDEDGIKGVLCAACSERVPHLGVWPKRRSA